MVFWKGTFSSNLPHCRFDRILIRGFVWMLNKLKWSDDRYIEISDLNASIINNTGKYERDIICISKSLFKSLINVIDWLTIYNENHLNWDMNWMRVDPSMKICLQEPFTENLQTCSHMFSFVSQINYNNFFVIC